MADLGTILGGLSAAVGGTAPQFQRQMMQDEENARTRALQDEQTAEKRRATMFMDAAAANQFLQSGDLDSVAGIFEDRMNILSQIPNVDTRHTREKLGLVRAARSGDTQALSQLQSQLGNEVAVGKAYGILPTADQSSTVQTLKFRAQQAGLVEGTPEYQEFMRSGGGGSMEGSSGITKYKNGVAVQYLGAGRTRVLHPVEGEITDPVRKQQIIDEAIASGPAEAGAIAAATETARGNVQRGQEIISSGRSAAQAIPAIKSSLVLLDKIKTGGIAGIGLRLRRALGGENADEGELAYNLRKQVLQQLKPTFGAAFTAREGDLLREIEASESRSTEANVRLLTNLLQALQLDAEMGRTRALDMEDTPTVREIDSYLNAQLGANSSGIFNEIYQDMNPSGNRVIRFDENGEMIQ